MSQTVEQKPLDPGSNDRGATQRDGAPSLLEPIRQILRPIASLRLTVVLFVLSLALVFFGTVAQKHKETFTVVDEYFYSWVVRIPFQLFAELGKVFLGLPDTTTVSGVFPFPAGKTIGWALFINLVAAHLVRFRFTWKRAGILIIHAGVAVLLLGEFITREYAVEATMSIPTGGKTNFVDVSRKVELAFVAPSEPTVEDVVVVPQSFFRKGDTVRHPELPVDVEVLDFVPNSFFEDVRANDPDGVAVSDVSGREGYVKFIPVAEESGTSTGRANAPMVRVRLKKKDSDTVLGTYTLSLWSYPNFTRRGYKFPPQTVKIDNTEYTVELRPKRVYKPYSIELKDFQVELYPGTNNPKGYASETRLEDKELGEERDVRIWMNHPLRHRGETFYQSSFFVRQDGTILQVVQNPGAVLPYVSCSMISGGMLIHFGILLTGFLRRRAAV